MIFAGVWDIWFKGDYGLKTFSIITTEANEDVSDIHDRRMPVLLTTPEQQRRWLESEDLDEVIMLLQTPQDHIIKKYRVTDKVNAVTNDSPDMHLEVPEPPTLFG